MRVPQQLGDRVADPANLPAHGREKAGPPGRPRGRHEGGGREASPHRVPGRPGDRGHREVE